MLSSVFLLSVFFLAFRWFGPQSALTTAAGIPCVVLAGLFAMNFFEPAAQAVVNSTGLLSLLRPEADFISFLVLFLGGVAALLKLVALFPKPPRLPDPYELRACLVLTLTASYLVMSITLTACDTSPRLQRVLGLRPDAAALFGFIAPDSQWLSFVGFVADGSLSRPKQPVPEAIAAVTPPSGSSPGSQVRTLRRRFIEVPAKASAGVKDQKNAKSPAKQP